MSEWGIALIAAGAAIAGSVVTGWYSRSAGIRQADAARHAGDRQAEALLESVRMTVRGEAEQRALAVRRQVYAGFLGAAEARVLAERTGRGGEQGDAVLLQRALGEVVLEGPSDVAAAAARLVDALRRHEPPDDLNRAKLAFVTEARRALDTAPPAPRS
ncbi:hypothetical protein GTY75_35815 [Streptomyces sp. SID8381]|uniref:hypothetical protein n=1 Tax=unclassified Streptomyces TaxID=2593676 RepID=UPI0003601A86|nr:MULTISPECIES: hypothetical protein [unclassified Streptomyces]MYX31902.1 hypothetical protein [Streptomyces sp. SID8381]